MTKEIFNSVIENIALELKLPLSKLPNYLKSNIEEIRLRVNSPLLVYAEGKDYFVDKNGLTVGNPKDALIVNMEQLNKTFQLICSYSVYALKEEIRNGFITIKGGHRIGIGGKIIYGNEGIEGIKNISSLNFRIAREKPGISDQIMKFLFRDQKFCNTLIISPPQCGKTTLLRDMIRNLSNGMNKPFIKGYKIGLVDERSEIAGIYNGIPQKEIGIRTDVLDSCLKSHGIIMLIRSMSPNIIAVDEIGGDEDIKAIEDALRAGIKLIATVHGYSIDDIKERKSLKDLFSENVFERYIILDNSRGVGTIREIIDANNLKNLLREEEII
jgi:stage III sporulation protein AA